MNIKYEKSTPSCTNCNDAPGVICSQCSFKINDIHPFLEQVCEEVSKIYRIEEKKTYTKFEKEELETLLIAMSNLVDSTDINTPNNSLRIYLKILNFYNSKNTKMIIGEDFASAIIVRIEKLEDRMIKLESLAHETDIKLEKVLKLSTRILGNCL